MIGGFLAGSYDPERNNTDEKVLAPPFMVGFKFQPNFLSGVYAGETEVHRVAIKSANYFRALRYGLGSVPGQMCRHPELVEGRWHRPMEETRTNMVDVLHLFLQSATLPLISRSIRSSLSGLGKF